MDSRYETRRLRRLHGTTLELSNEVNKIKDDDKEDKKKIAELSTRVDAIEAQLPLPTPRAEQDAAIDALTDIDSVKLYLKTLLPRLPQ